MSCRITWMSRAAKLFKPAARVGRPEGAFAQAIQITCLPGSSQHSIYNIM